MQWYSYLLYLKELSRKVRDLGNKVVTMDKCFGCITRVKEIRNELTLYRRYDS